MTAAARASVVLKKALTIRLSTPAGLPAARTLFGQHIEGYFNAAFLPGATRRRMQVVCRTAYYALDARGFQIGPPVLEKARNVLLDITPVDGGARFEARRVEALDGLEDIRFFPVGEALLFYAVGLVPEGDRLAPKPVIGRARWSGDLIIEERREATENVQRVEKNWVFFRRGDEVLIEKYPGMAEIYRVDPQTLALEHRRLSDKTFDWSGTKAVQIQGGALFLDHRRMYLLRGPRTVQRYVYQFRFEPDDGGPARISRRFSLGPDSDLGYASDLALDAETGDLLIAVSADDASFEVFAVPLAGVLSRLN